MIMHGTQRTTARLTLTVQQGITVLPRCLQILSRRGYIVLGLSTKTIADNEVTLVIDTEGSSHWHKSLPHLLARLVEVKDVKVEEL